MTASGNLVELRVHFAAVGFEVLRLTDPLKTLRAEAVVLLTKGRDDKAAKYLAAVEKKLDAEGLPYVVVECNIWSLADVVDVVAGIVEASPDHQYFFNVSTGSTPAHLAGAIAGMLWKVKPYYVPVDYDTEVGRLKDHPVSGPPEFVPTFRVPRLERSHLVALEFLTKQAKPIPKALLLEHLKEAGVVKPRLRKKEKVTSQAFQAQVDSILNQLSKWAFVKRDGSGKQLRISVTEKGRAGNHMFRHALEHREPIRLLR